ncbi:hypothetical protein [Glutamicibacter ardleyensis]|uniref:hypothetical protein n=1 Tax=Glutamicibacter ardleyensis TaxID=225894 RepID=UPI003FD11E12
MNTDNLMLFGLDLTDLLMAVGSENFVESAHAYHPHDVSKALNTVGMLVTQVLASLVEQPTDAVIETYSVSIIEASAAMGLESVSRNILNAIGRTGQAVPSDYIDSGVASCYELILGTLIGICATLDELTPEEFMTRLCGVAF